MEQLLTSQEVADLLRVTTRTVGNLVKRGQLAKVKVGRSVRFEATEVDRYLKSSAVPVQQTRRKR